MALKDLILSSLPQYCETLPSGKQVCFRPMVVSEEKALILAKNTSDRIGLLKTLENILINCCQDFKKTDFKKLKISDLEHLFLLLRSKSIGEVEGFTLKCPHTDENIILKIDVIKDLKIHKSSTNNKIKLTNNLILVMNEPTVEHLIKTPNYDSTEEDFYKFTGSCIKQVHTVNEIKDCKDLPEIELTEFIKALTSQQLQQIINYFDELTRLEIVKEYQTTDGVKRNIRIKGLFNYINFFFEHLNVESLYKQFFQLKYYHNYSIDEIEMMIPWERTIHIEQIKEHLNEERNLKLTTEGALYGR
jgi:hypothetical protein